MSSTHYNVYGVERSYFTRKMTCTLNAMGLQYQLKKGRAHYMDAAKAGYPGGIPFVKTMNNEYAWDTTRVAEHLEYIHGNDKNFSSLLPTDSVSLFLNYLIEDMSDEWLYRCATGTRWYFPENTTFASHDLALDSSVGIYANGMGIPTWRMATNIADRVRTSCPPGGFNETTRDSFVSEVLWPWMELLSTHFKTYPFLFGNRPSLADVAIFGGAAAHFAQDPLCRRWCDEKGPYLVAHTHRLLENGAEFNERNLQERQWKSYDWDPTTNMSNSMMAILTDAGRLYLPWVSKACVDGEAVLEFKSGIKVNIKPTPFLMESRQIMLARYEKLKSPKLNLILKKAGILKYFEGFKIEKQLEDISIVPQPYHNRGFPTPNAVDEKTGRADNYSQMREMGKL